MKPHLTPVHCLTIRNQAGDTHYLLINGGYCDVPNHDKVEAQHPGWKIVESTWRADWTQLALPSNSEPNYAAGASSHHPSPSQPPWRSDPATALTQAA